MGSDNAGIVRIGQESDDLMAMHRPRATPQSSGRPAPGLGGPAEHHASRLRRVGQRVTSQRLLILDAFHPGEHISADEVLSRVEAQLPAVNRSTVYRTLELFRDLGLVSETDLGGGVREFELIAEQRHHHMICHQCGAIADFDAAVVAPLRQALRHHHGFTATVDHLAIFGWGAACVADEQRLDIATPS